MIRKLWEGFKSLRRGGASGWDFGERRELVRLRCHVEVNYTVGSKRYFGQVVDMSLGGMMLRCLQPPTLGSLTDVSYEIDTPGVTEKTVRCRMQWSKRRRRDHTHFVGLSYSSSEDVLRQSWVKATLRDLGFRPERIFQKRKHVRVNCFLPGQLTTQAGQTVEGRVYNMGANGMLLEADASLEEGQAVELTVGPHEPLDALKLKGRVVSNMEVNRLRFLGVEFEPLSPALAAKLAEYLRVLLEEGGGV